MNIGGSQRSNGDPDAGQFMYGRLGPWPQPSSTHPIREVAEVVHVPPDEVALWNGTIGTRYVQTLEFMQGLAGANAAEGGAMPIPDDATFTQYLLGTAYSRFLHVASAIERERVTQYFPDTSDAVEQLVIDFTAMSLVKPLPGTYVAPTRIYFAQRGPTRDSRRLTGIECNGILVGPNDPAWALSKAYALQGAAYHILFVVHPAIHFPLDSVNAVTKTAIPRTHPIFQLLYPYARYQLVLDNAVLESAASVVNVNAPATYFDPLTAGSNDGLRALFGAGYSGFPDVLDPAAYPVYDYLTLHFPDSDYGDYLRAYWDAALAFGTAVATKILADDPADPFPQRWAASLKPWLLGFPPPERIASPEVLGFCLARFVFETTVSHAADHASFTGVPVFAKYLRIRVPPPVSPSDGPVPNGGAGLSSPDDLFRAELAQMLFFGAHTMTPNLNESYCAFTDPVLLGAQVKFHADLVAVDQRFKASGFMRLVPDATTPYDQTISASIQY